MYTRQDLIDAVCRLDLYEFTKYTHFNWLGGWFHQEVCAALMQFYRDVKDGKQPHLMIFAPPRHGKSEIVSRRFPAWVFGDDPDLEIIGCSYSSDLASQNNRDVQKVMETEQYGRIFPDTRLGSGKDSSLKNSDLFEIAGHRGSYRGAGVGGGITGRGFDIGIIDDPLKNAEEANSQTIRDAIANWYSTTFYTRRSPKSGVLVMQTRWHVDDLAGRLLKDTSGKWKVLNFPALAEVDEPHRKAGEALHPERYPVPFFDAIKADPNFSRKDFDALFQQKPQIVGGNIIHGADFKEYEVLPPQLSFRFMTCDTAQKIKKANDFSVFACWGVADNRLYLIDLLRGKWEAPELKKRALSFWDKHRERGVEMGVLRKMYVEDKSSGTGLIQEIKSEAKIPIEAIQRNIDKYSRVSDVLGRIESGYVYLPKGAPFVIDFLSECEAFTANDSHSFDDQVDVLCDGIEKGIPIAKRDWDAIAKGING